MTRLREVMQDTGMPQDNFLVVPNGGINLIWLDGSKGPVSFTGDAKITVQAVRGDQVSKLVEKYVRQFGQGMNTTEDPRKQLWTRMLSITDRLPGHLLAVTGKAPGWAKLKVAGGGKTFDVEVAVVKRQWVDISFRFLRHRESSGALVPDTIYNPADAGFFIPTLNWIYGPQTNITFDLWDAEWVDVSNPPPQPLGKDLFVNSIATQAPKGPDITVFLVGKWGGGASGHSRGSFFDDLDVAAIDDRPARNEIPEPIDVFMLNMAHEILHYLRKERGFTGHHDRQNVLLSNKIQSLRMDKQLVMDVNPP